MLHHRAERNEMTRTASTLLLFLSCLFPAIPAVADTTPYWVFFTDRGAVNIARGVAAKAASPEEPKNTGRRARLLGRRIFDERDLPVHPDYIAGVAGITGGVRTVTRYFNGVTVDADEAQVRRIEALPFVRSVEPVTRYRRSTPPRGDGAAPERHGKAAQLSYGASFFQLDAVGVPKLHTRGHMGEGIRIGVLDSGFDDLGHVAFDSLTVSHQWDFIQRDEDVRGDDHGTRVLSIMAALDRGDMIGAAPYATYMLARTEIINPPDSTEDYKVEEDYWVAAVEWADSLGADIIQSSLGYTDFVDGPDYTYSDLDGETAITSIAAGIAVEKGIVVVNSAGNEGNDPWYYISTPADGKGVIAVGSVRYDGNLQPVVSSFSSRGPTFDGRIKPDFVALGENVVVVGSMQNTYTSGSGTSYAAPAVSGAAALLLQVHPDWTPAVLHDSLRVTATPVGADSLAGYGLINAFAASGLSDGGPAIASFRVYDPYPQPVQFAGSNTRIYFPLDVPAGGKRFAIRIFSFSGEEVKALEGVIPSPGSYRDRIGAPSWDGTNFTGDAVAPGIYFYTVQVDGYGAHKGKLAVMR